MLGSKLIRTLIVALALGALGIAARNGRFRTPNPNPGKEAHDGERKAKTSFRSEDVFE